MRETLFDYGIDATSIEMFDAPPVTAEQYGELLKEFLVELYMLSEPSDDH